MPLKHGSGKATISANIAELIGSWKKTHKIGNARPKTLAQAQKMAAAIAYSKARGKKK